MTIIEAIKSGKRFRHSLTGTSWFNPIKDPDTSLVNIKLDVNQLVSNDWEVEEVRTTISETEFCAAWKRANWRASVKVFQQNEKLFSGLFVDELYVSLKQELGL